MKRLVFKKWVNWLVIGIMLLAIMTMVGESENTFIFIVSKGVALVITYIAYRLLAKYGRREVL